MSAFRIAVRAVVPKVRPSTLRASPSLLRRGYADVASDKLRVTLSLPHQVRLFHHPSSAMLQGIRFLVNWYSELSEPCDK